MSRVLCSSDQSSPSSSGKVMDRLRDMVVAWLMVSNGR